MLILFYALRVCENHAEKEAAATTRPPTSARDADTIRDKDGEPQIICQHPDITPPRGYRGACAMPCRAEAAGRKRFHQRRLYTPPISRPIRFRRRVAAATQRIRPTPPHVPSTTPQRSARRQPREARAPPRKQKMMRRPPQSPSRAWPGLRYAACRCSAGMSMPAARLFFRFTAR